MRHKLRMLTGLILLMLSISSAFATAAEKKSEAVREKGGVSTASKSQTSLCREIAKMIKDRSIDQYMPERVDIPVDVDPHGSEYLHLDIDGDGISDKVTVSSGSMESLLVVQLSGGGKYNLDEDRIMPIKFKKQIYALATYWKWDIRPDGSTTGKITGYRLYKLTKLGAKVVCDKEDLERR